MSTTGREPRAPSCLSWPVRESAACRRRNFGHVALVSRTLCAKRGASMALVSASKLTGSCLARGCGESHSLVVHKLWVLDAGGSNPPSPTRSKKSGCLQLRSQPLRTPLRPSLLGGWRRASLRWPPWPMTRAALGWLPCSDERLASSDRAVCGHRSELACTMSLPKTCRVRPFDLRIRPLCSPRPVTNRICLTARQPRTVTCMPMATTVTTPSLTIATMTKPAITRMRATIIITGTVTDARQRPSCASRLF